MFRGSERYTRFPLLLPLSCLQSEMDWEGQRLWITQTQLDSFTGHSKNIWGNRQLMALIFIWEALWKKQHAARPLIHSISIMLTTQGNVSVGSLDISQPYIQVICIGHKCHHRSLEVSLERGKQGNRCCCSRTLPGCFGNKHPQAKESCNRSVNT